VCIGVFLVSIARRRETVQQSHRPLEMLRRQVAVPHDHLECLMPEELGDGPKRDTSHGKVACEGVTEVVGTEVCNVRPRQRVLEGFSDIGVPLPARIAIPK